MEADLLAPGTAVAIRIQCRAFVGLRPCLTPLTECCKKKKAIIKIWQPQNKDIKMVIFNINYFLVPDIAILILYVKGGNVVCVTCAIV